MKVLVDIIGKQSLLSHVLSHNFSTAKHLPHLTFAKRTIYGSVENSLNNYRYSHRFTMLSNVQKYFFAQATQFPRINNYYKPKIPVYQFLDAQQLDYMESPNTFKIKYCPFCPKPHNEERTNLYVLNVHKEYGYYKCFRCSASGNWLQFREKILGLDSSITPETIMSNDKSEGSYGKGGQTGTKISQVEYFFYKQNLWNKEYKDVLDYVKSRGFTQQTIKKYNLGAGTEEFYDQDGQCHKVQLVYFPFYKKKQSKNMREELLQSFEKKKDQNFTYNNDWTELIKVKMRGASKETKKYMRQYPIGGTKGLFGYNLIKDTDNVVVVTEGEFDAMAVHQETGYPSVSLPQGASSLPDVLLPYFDKFDKIYLWMDNDQAGILNTSKIAQKLGLKKTFIVRHTIPKLKDANDFLLKSPSLISEMLHKAKTIPDNNLIGFGRLRDTIKQKMVNQEIYRGAKVSWLPFFNQKVKGIRPGELTVVSGPTGSGKTTFLSQLFLDICQRDIAILWGSFQIRNQVLVAHMLNQFANLNIAKNIDKYEYYAQRFQKLPLHLMNFFGSTNIEKIISTIIYSIQKYNIHMVILDTLQFILSEQAEGFKKFELQDSLMARLREISIKFNVHIAIVIHPRKTEDGEDIGIHSIYGTSKATQEADNIWMIQNREGYKLLDIKKNRYDGELGRIPLGFNRETKRFFQLKKAEFQDLKEKQRTMADIIRDREMQQMGQKTMTDEQLHLMDEQIQDTELNKKTKNNANGFSHFKKDN